MTEETFVGVPDQWRCDWCRQKKDGKHTSIQRLIGDSVQFTGIFCEDCTAIWRKNKATGITTEEE